MHRRFVFSLIGLRAVGTIVTLTTVLCGFADAGDWPTYQGDSARSGHTSATLPDGLSLHWTFRTAAPPRPAWPTNERQTEDRANQLIVADGRVFFGDSSDGQLYAIDETTGQVLWTFPTEGPIRYAPVTWRGRIFVASDDGYLYALNASDGSLIWKKRGGPSDQLVLGNERLISKWPARGGPVLVEDDGRAIVYFAAGIWPSDGIFLYSLDAETGKVLWQNDDSGSINMPQPHGGAVAESGVSAQGYLAVANDRLLMPTGRAVPAVFDRTDGSFEYFHLQKFGQNGGSVAIACGDYFLNGGVAFRLADGKRLFTYGSGPTARTASGLVRASGTTIQAMSIDMKASVDRHGEPIEQLTPAKRWSATLPSRCVALITTGDQIVAGCEGQVVTLDVGTGEIMQTLSVEGSAYGLAATDQGLYISTDLGIAYRFSVKTDTLFYSNAEFGIASSDFEQSETPSAESLAAKAAKEILYAGISKGYCVDLECGDGQLACELAKRSDLYICAFDNDPEQLAIARKNLIDAGLYGSRVSLHLRDPSDSGCLASFANLAVSGSSLGRAGKGVPSSLMSEARRMLQPGGSLYLGGPSDEISIACFPASEPSAGKWSHQYADPANTACSNDEIVRGNLTMHWFRDFDFPTPSRHGRGPAPLFDRGVLVYEGLDGLIGVDAYNGCELWRYDLPGVLRAYDGDELMGLAGTGSNYCMGDGSVFAAYKDRCVQLDAKTGALQAEFVAPDRKDDTPGIWGYIAYHNGTLFGSLATPEHIVTYRYVASSGDMSRLLTESSALFAYDVSSCELKWRYNAEESIRHNAIAISGDKDSATVYLIDRPMAMFDREKRPASKEHTTGTLLALNAETGEPRWRQPDDVYGTTLAVGAKQGVLLMTYQPTRFRLDSEFGGRMAGFDLTSGKRIWDIDANYESRVMLNNGTIYAQGGAWRLRDGQPVPFEFSRSYGCGILASGAHMLCFRSATFGYYDLSGDRRTKNYGGIRPGCWINAIPAGGLVLMPDATAGCRCSYLTTAWVALAPETDSRQ